jgi:hypothetical protein
MHAALIVEESKVSARAASFHNKGMSDVDAGSGRMVEDLATLIVAADGREKRHLQAESRQVLCYVPGHAAVGEPDLTGVGGPQPERGLGTPDKV